MGKCKICGLDHSPKKWQIKRKEFICKTCYNTRSRKYAKNAKANGKPYVTGKMSAEYWKEYRKEYCKRPHVKEFYKENFKRLRTDPKEQPKIIARAILRNALRRGDIIKMPCKVCGTSNSEAHHENYDSPLDVTWLCRLHHKKEHHPITNSYKQ